MYYLFIFIVFLTSTVSLALHQPTKSNFDTRIRYTSYNAHDVVQLDTVIGIATHIVLEEGERYLTHVFGDAEAYAFAFKKNHLFLKPKADNADTNLTVVTDRRSYHFRLTFKPSLHSSAVYQLVFHYPDSTLKAQQEKYDRERLEKNFQELPSLRHLNYTMSGDEDIAPIHAWDDEVFTYFKFSNHCDLPTIYMVDEDDQESIVNRHSLGRDAATIAVHKIHDRWVLRLGDRALMIYNEDYKDPLESLNTGTSLPSVQRYIRKALI